MQTAKEILEKKSQALITVPSDTLIETALEIMIKNRIGSMVIMEGEQVIGIWTERDLMRNLLTEDFDIKKAKIGDYMTKHIYYAKSSESAYLLMDKFLGLRLRHILIKENHKFIGMISIGDVIKSRLLDTHEDLIRENAKISWQYYEEWKWTPKK